MGGKVIFPGQSVTLKAKVNYRGKRGKQEKTIAINSNDPEQPKAVIKLTAYVVADVDVIPSKVDFRSMQEGQEVSKKVQIINKGPVPLNITGFDVHGSFFKVTKTVVEEGRKVELEVKAEPPFSQNVMSGKIFIATDHPKYPSISIPVRIQQVSEVVVAPRVINVPFMGPMGGEDVYRLILRSRTGKDFKILEVVTPDPKIEINVEEIGRGAYSVKVANIQETGDLDGKFIRIVTDSASSREIRVPIKVDQRR